MKLKYLIIIGILIVLFPINVKAEINNGIIVDKNGTYYYINGIKQTGFHEIDGKTYFFGRLGNKEARTGVVYIDGSYYRFDHNGVMQTGWFIDDGEKTYYHTDGKRVNGFQTIDGKKYFFGRLNNNELRTGIIKIDNFYYRFDQSGVMQTGWFVDDGEKTYYQTDGKRVSGFQTIDGKKYFFGRLNNNELRTGIIKIDNFYHRFDQNGVMQTGWFVDSGEKTYYQTEGKRVSGFQTIDGKKYFFGRLNNNTLRTGTIFIDGNYYNFDESGVMQTGWNTTIEGTKYYDSDGKMQTGITEIFGSKYFFDKNGYQKTGFQNYKGNTYFFSRMTDKKMLTGFLLIDGKYYYFDNSGKMQKGFQTIKGTNKFFSRINGEMRTNWLLFEGHMYYCHPTTGDIQTGEHMIDGVKYFFYNDGKLKDGFTTDYNGNIRYYFPDGSFAKTWTTITGEKYFFNSLGNMIAKNASKVIDVSAYQGIVDWKTVITKGEVDGVILRVAAGAQKEDAQLARNVSELNRLKIPYGIYIYSYAEDYFEGRIYADFVVNSINRHKMNPKLGIYLDLESNSVTQDMGVKEYEEVTRGFFDVMQAKGYGNLTKIYTYTSYANTALNSEYLRSKIDWIAQYNHYCTYKGKYKGWQYSSTINVPGIKGDVDGNVWFEKIK